MEKSIIKSNFNYLNLWVLLVIILFGFALYIYPLKNASFCFDDHVTVENNDVIKKIDTVKIFNAFNTRFLPGLSFALNYKFSGLNPSGYRLVNLLIHCLNAFLVYLLIKSTLNILLARKLMFFCPLEWVAFLGSLLFLSHPVQTEPVNFITQRFVLMGTFFYLLTLLLYIQYRCQKQKEYMIASLLTAISAMLCKEFVVTLPLMLTLYDFCFLNETIGKRFRYLWPFFIVILIVPFLLLKTNPEAIKVAAIAEPNSIHHMDITRARHAVGRQEYFLTELNVMCTYVRLLFVPIDQNLFYSYPISYHVDNKTVCCGVFLLCLLVLAVLMYRSYRIISFCISWFFIALSVESSFIPIGHVIAEYRLYLASVGFVFLIMGLTYMKQENQKKSLILIVVLIAGFSVLTHQRNKVWKDDVTLWSDEVSKSPQNANPYGNRGMIYYRLGEFSKAMSDFNKAIEINPQYEEAYHDRGLIYDQEGKTSQALWDYNKAIELNPNDIEVLNNRGSIFLKQDELFLALCDYDKAIEINPVFMTAYDNRFNVYKALLYKVGKGIADK